MSELSKENYLFKEEKISKVLLKIAPPVMLSQLIMALYNIVDSLYVGRYSDHALNALTVIYPLQLIIVALATGTGVGVNTFMAKKYALNDTKSANKTAGTGLLLAIISWLIFAISSCLLMNVYVNATAKSVESIQYAKNYGYIICIGSLGSFLEGVWSKVIQSKGNMKLPMIAQVVGALINIVLDPILIFGGGIIPSLGVIGAAVATIIGQFCSAIIVSFKGIRKIFFSKETLFYVKQIYFYGYSSIFMQLLFTVYIELLNLILASFSEDAVTVLGLYYKLQSFFFIPLFGLQVCIVPFLSYNYTISQYSRCKKIMNHSFLISAIFMFLGIMCFILIPKQLMALFSANDNVMQIGSVAFPIIGSSFISAVFSLMMPVFFQSIGKGIESVFLSLLRQIICLVPIFYAFSFIGLNYVWIAFPLSETIAGLTGIILYIKELKKWKKLSYAK